MALVSAFDSLQQALPINGFIILSLTSFFLVWYLYNHGSRHSLPLPPGPRKLPLLGNSLDMPMTDQHIVFAQWAEKFDSDILHLKVVGGNCIVLSSYEAAMDLLDKRSSIYSSRPRVTMLQDLIGWEGDLVYLPYGNAWKAHRKLLHQEFHPSDSSAYRPHHKKALRLFLNNLIETPEEWLRHIQQMTRSIILAVAYGIHVQVKDDPSIIAAEEMFAVLNTAGIPGSFLVDVFPLLKHIPTWFPGASFKRRAQEWYDIRNETITPPFLKVKQAMANGNAEDCFSLRCLANAQSPDPRLDHLSEEEEMIKQTAGSMYEGGADTGITALRTFLLAMMCFPDVQCEAQEELDRVIGQERLPDYDDLDGSKGLSRLPFVWAIIYECFRWQAIVPLSVPHQVDTEDTYKGYYIPKGSTIMPNVWAILRDKKTYGPTAHMFNPKRWLLKTDSNETGHCAEAQWRLNPDMRDPVGITFGFGRRVCPGKHMGLASFQMNVASLLHSFNITPPLDDNGHVVNLEIEYVSGLLNGPVPFECSIKPRSEKHIAVVRRGLFEV
ncbi:cytochrome P450 [Lentinula edodes]|uniref:cytochrome P450 n=1 Tax=Lentinula edodes TaxID=5353 RepID=UPI001E8E204C|nr:cytochrome P450 [Lentinula edodes]KAH7881400.1 cytochrome P450 [Lentinula edodes]